MKLIIDEMFKSEYLTPGQTYDNFIFENCSNEFLEKAFKYLSKEASLVKPCNVQITNLLAEKVEKTLENCKDNFQVDALARDYVTALVMKEALKNITQAKHKYNDLIEQINAFYENDFDKVKQFYMNSFFPYEVADFSKKINKIELNFFLIDMKSKTIQKAINNFISQRAPYSVKIFTNNNLASYYDQCGNIIQPPHDYMTRNVNEFVEIQEEHEKGFQI
ncbi:MAG: hypothetical protein IKY10_03140 [Clostridia bacterium]|nr:hypothetical protein [Clostridia bacterium]